MNNPYLPQRAEIIEVKQETFSEGLDIKTFKIKLIEGKMEFLPGQFIEFSLPGVGECPFGFASSPLIKDYIELTIKRTGQVTDAIHQLTVGDTCWIRGPFGNTFPMEKLKGNNLLFIAGGLGLAPLRPFILYALDENIRNKYGNIDMLLAARTPADHVFAYDLENWKRAENTNISLTVDMADEQWKGYVGFPHVLVKEMDLDFKNLYAILCGPPMMIKAVQKSLEEMGMARERLYTTLEMRMSCGVGKCGKCNIGHRYVCVDGPVFCMSELARMPDEY